MITKNEILIKLKELKPDLYKDYSVKEIGLFGSFSDDSFTDASDIDILVELEKPIGWKFFSFHLSPLFSSLHLITPSPHYPVTSLPTILAG